MLWKIIGWVVIGFVALFVVSFIFSIITAIIGLAITIVTFGLSIAIVGALIFAAVKLYQTVIGSGSSSSKSDEIDATPEEILREQYIEGMIDEDEYEKALEDLLNRREGNADKSSDKEIELLQN